MLWEYRTEMLNVEHTHQGRKSNYWKSWNTHKEKLEENYLVKTTCLLHHSWNVFSRKPAWKPLLGVILTFSLCTANTLEKAVVSATITGCADDRNRTRRRHHTTHTTCRRGARREHKRHINFALPEFSEHENTPKANDNSGEEAGTERGFKGLQQRSKSGREADGRQHRMRDCRQITIIRQ